jgi:hypothetical protein
MAVTAATTTTMPAWADPPAGVRPSEFDAVGGGSDFTEFLFDQFSHDYNAAHPVHDAGHPHLYSFDTGAFGEFITPKQDCGQIARPGNSSAAIGQVSIDKQTLDKKYFCFNYAGSARPREPMDPPYEPGGIAFAALGGNIVSWAAQATTDAPKSLTVVQLRAIYTCTDTNWHQVGGKNAPIVPFLPEAGSDIDGLFLATIGVTTPGPCVSNDNDTLAENQGVNPVLDSPGAIVPYSAADYIAQKFHSAPCSNTGCSPGSGGTVCTPTGSDNRYGCDTHGTLKLGSVDGIAPTVGTGRSTALNPSFPATFDYPIYAVVPYDPGTADHIPGPEAGAPGGIDLEQFFAANGWVCLNPQAIRDLKNYGFVPIRTCGGTN